MVLPWKRGGSRGSLAQTQHPPCSRYNGRTTLGLRSLFGQFCIPQAMVALFDLRGHRGHRFGDGLYRPHRIPRQVVPGSKGTHCGVGSRWIWSGISHFCSNRSSTHRASGGIAYFHLPRHRLCGCCYGLCFFHEGSSRRLDTGGRVPSELQNSQRSARNYTLGEAVKTWQWWALCLFLSLNTMAGLSIISQASPNLPGIGKSKFSICRRPCGTYQYREWSRPGILGMDIRRDYKEGGFLPDVSD